MFLCRNPLTFDVNGPANLLSFSLRERERGGEGGAGRQEGRPTETETERQTHVKTK